MLNFESTRLDRTQEFKIKTGVSVSEEGLILVQDSENGLEVAKLATGTADVFLGFSFGLILSPVTKSLVEALTVPADAPYTVDLQRTPISGQIYIVNSLGTEQTAGDPVNANQYSISGTTITFHSGQAGLVETITYRYSPTAMELQAQDNLLITSISASELLGSIGAIREGEIYTNLFDASVAYAIGNAVGMAAGGLITETGSNDIPNAVITHAPTVDFPFVGVRVS